MCLLKLELETVSEEVVSFSELNQNIRQLMQISKAVIIAAIKATVENIAIFFKFLMYVNGIVITMAMD